MLMRVWDTPLKQLLYLFYFALVFAGLAFGSYYFIKNVTFQNPDNCKICHYMTPSYNKWAASTHSKVPCLKCHDYTPMNSVASQVKFLAGTYRGGRVCLDRQKRFISDKLPIHTATCF